MQERKRKKRECGEETTDDLSTDVQGTFDSLAGLVSGLKVAGEGMCALLYYSDLKTMCEFDLSPKVLHYI